MRQRVRNAAEDEIKFLLRLSKKGKGTVDLDLAERALGLIGFSIEPTRLAFDLAKHSDGGSLLRTMLKPWVERHRIRFIHGPRYSDPKVWSFAFEDSQDVAGARADLEGQIVTVTTPPDVVDVGQLYFTEILSGSTVGAWPGFHVKKIWLGDTALVVTAPSGKSVTIPMPVTHRGMPETSQLNIASLWTFLYKNGAAEAAKKYLDEQSPETVEKATRTKAERERIERQRSALPEIEQVFVDLTNERYEEVVAYLRESYLAEVDRVLRDQAAGTLRYRDVSPLAKQLMRQTYGEGRKLIWEPQPDYERRALELATESANAARQEFVDKNTFRISEIVRRKNMLPKADVLDIRGSRFFDSDIQFSFPDGSRFDLRNKTVWKRSPLGVLFAQFPTTFHNVVLPGGKKMSQPSEARMLDVFAAERVSNPRAVYLAQRLSRGD